MKNAQCPNCNKREVCMLTKDIQKLYNDIVELTDKYDSAAVASFNVNITCKHFSSNNQPVFKLSPDKGKGDPFPMRGVTGAYREEML